MVSKSETTSALASEHRATLLREIFGIILAVCALLIFLALTSAPRVSNWIGPAGAVVARNLNFILGQYVAYALPLMLAVCALHALRGMLPMAAPGRAWVRGLGGLLLIVASCAVLTLSVPEPPPLTNEDAEVAAAVRQAYAERAYLVGGLVGNWLIDGEHGGLGFGKRFGRVGATLIFGGLSLMGLVLFTETLLRDLGMLLWRALRRAGRLARRLPWPARWRLRCPRWVRALSEALQSLAGVFAWLGTVRRWLAGVQFSTAHSRRVMPVGPILELTALPHGRAAGLAEPAQAAHADTADHDEDSRALAADPAEIPALLRQGARRGTGVFGRTVPRADAITPEADGGSSAALPGELAHPLHGAATALPPGAVDPAAAADPAARARRAAPETPVPAEQNELNLFPKEYRLPGLDLLADPPALQYVMSPEERDTLSRRIEQTLAQFKVEVQVFEVIQGPVITRFALKVAPGVRVNKIQSLESELAMALKAPHVRILAPIPGQAAVGIEVPNKKANPVLLKDLLSSEPFQKSKSPLAFALGKNIAGETVICDLASMPHLLIAGTTGSGKSVCLNAIIASLLYRNKPDRVKFVMVDPKRVELSIYQAIPHLIAPVVSETKKAAAALAWCVEQMESRYKLLAEIGVRNLDSYNALLNDKIPSKKILGRGDLKFLPHIVIIIDELADLMMVAKNEVEEYIIRLAQMARAVGMHLVLATQRPSVNVITGIIKANFPSRIAFQVSSKVDSRTILDINGAEALLGRGDMLYSPGGAKPFRIQGAFVADAEVERLADFIREQEKARYEKEDFEARPTPAERAKAQMTEGGERSHPAHGHGAAGAGGDGGDDDWDPPFDAGDDEGSTLLTGRAASRAASINMGPLSVEGRAAAAPLTPADMEQLSDDMLYDLALKLILESRKASVSYIQRRMKIGYARAGRIMDLLEENGIVGPYQGSKPRDLLVNPDDYLRANE